MSQRFSEETQPPESSSIRRSVKHGMLVLLPNFGSSAGPNLWRSAMLPAGRIRFGFLLGFTAICILARATRAQETQYPKPMDLPNPYCLVEGWPTLPKAMNGGQWGEVIRVHVDDKGHIWVFHRCFNVVPAGSATCIGRGPANPPILEFDASGKLLKSS